MRESQQVVTLAQFHFISFHLFTLKAEALQRGAGIHRTENQEIQQIKIICAQWRSENHKRKERLRDVKKRQGGCNNNVQHGCVFE